MAGFIDVVKKVVTDPDIVKEGVELGVRALTMPDPDESTGDFRKSAFVTGQIAQSMADREEAERRKALQAEAERQRQAKIEERVFEAQKLIAGKQMDAAIKGKEQFFDTAKFWKKGTIDPSNGYQVKADCYNIKINELHTIKELIEECIKNK